MINEIVIGCDSNAFELKEAIKKYLLEHEYKVEDVSPKDKTIYPLIAKKAADIIKESNYTKRGILICGTGIGMAICANKIQGIYAAQVHDIYSAERAALSNNVNIITLGAFVVGSRVAIKLIAEWLSLEFIPGDSSEKIEAIKKIEKENLFCC